jgi:hypothetical protein
LFEESGEKRVGMYIHTVAVVFIRVVCIVCFCYSDVIYILTYMTIDDRCAYLFALHALG